ncbi:LysM peptidoglycan-binding domain-containing protein [Periweissella cryptocerci]|uniref:LysM peptidoglycan-binding domain-containing protein n=1 Tax=Periweissella cryptocerci TaxID=2506420 RepID=A0A4P6YUL5_9LACO|nr:NlpC/P60 family protein [Periweissella cryptocerci]QBO36440.1 LysM peptidoglycan-binding domain-containing protein [Periweissella cryptocerci]
MNKIAKNLTLTMATAGAAILGTSIVGNADITVTAKRGDNVFEIAEKYKSTIDQVAAYNHLNNPRLIFKGQKIVIPSKASFEKFEKQQAEKKDANTATTVDGTSQQADQKIASMITYAKQFIGTPYVWAGSSPKGFDCSGLVSYVYKNSLGIDLPHQSGQQAKLTTKIDVSEAKAGDLYFWSRGGKVYHVAIAIGDGKFIEAPQPGKKVSINTVSNFKPQFAGRVSQLADLITASSDDVNADTTAADAQAIMTAAQFKQKGRVSYDNKTFTYYSPDGSNRSGMGAYTADGTYTLNGRDKDGYLILASSKPFGTKVMTPLGMGVVHDRGTVGNHYDIVIK